MTKFRIVFTSMDPMNWYQLMFSARQQGRRKSRIAVGGGCDGANLSWVTLRTTPRIVLTCNLPNCKAVLVRDHLHKCCYIEAKTLKLCFL
jgi:hypothetical protein